MPKAINNDTDDDKRIDKVSIEVNGKAGHAYCVYSRSASGKSGTAKGGHMRMKTPPTVYEDSGKVQGGLILKIWEAAEAALPHMKNATGKFPKDGEERVTVILRVGSTKAATWKIGKAPAKDEVKALADLLMKYRVGGW